MKRAVICVVNPQDFIPTLDNYSIMIVNPDAPPARLKYLLDKSDYSLLITDAGISYRDGAYYPDERVLWYTSGTTGDSKFCSFSQVQLDFMAKNICRSYGITANDRYVSIMSLWHAHGQGMYWATNHAGCQRSFMSLKDIRSMPSLAPTFITAIPDVLRIVNNLEFDSLRFIRSASAPLPRALYTSLKDKFGVPVLEAFGMTEAMSHCFTNPLYGKQRIGTVGLPDGIDATIDSDSRLFIRGITLGSSNDWYDTGDLAHVDIHGYYSILGRSRDQINVRGVKVNPTSVEEQLVAALPDIGACVIFGKDQVKCLYTGTAKPDSIQAFLKSLGSHCRPTLLQWVNEIPLTPQGKVSRALLEVQFP